MFKKKQESTKGGKAPYPTQPAYPTQAGGAYPVQPSAPTAQGGAAGGAPPPYSQQPPSYQYQPPPGAPQYAPPPQGQPMCYPQPQGQMYGVQGAMYGGGYMPPQFPPGAQVVGHGQFDAGARFNSGAGMNIPPPPPGCMPNAAQIAAQHGGTVHMTQGKAGIFSTQSDGGVSTHID